MRRRAMRRSAMTRRVPMATMMPRALWTLLVLMTLPILSLQAQVSGEIRGRITDASTGRPVADARVELDGPGLAARTGVDGAYLLRSLEPRLYRVTVRALGFVSRTEEVGVQNARATSLDVTLEPMAPVLERMVVQATRDTVAPNATTFTRSTIEASGQRDLGDLLQITPGVVVTRSGGPGQPARVSIRGSSSNQVLILLDGVPLNSAISGAADLSAIPLENIERVTVLTGAQSARYGPRAMAGVIEIVTRRSQQERSILARVGALGEWGVAGTLGTTVQRGNGSRSASLGVDHRTVRGDFSYPLPALRGGGRADRLNADATTTQIVASSGVDIGNRQFTIRGSYGNTDRGMAGSIIQPSRSGRQDFSRLNGGATAQWSPGRWVVASTADVTRERGRYTDPSPPFGQAFADTVSATGLTVTSSATATWHPMTTAAGIEVRHLALTSNNLAANAPDGQTLAGAWFNARAERTLDNGARPTRLLADLALRVDHSSLLTGASLSPRFMLRTERGPAAVSVSYGAGFAPPTIADQFFHEGVQVRANPSLRPERTKHDLEARAGLRDVTTGPLHWTAEAAAFRSDVQGMILWFPDFRFIWSPNNYDVHRRGWEARSGLRIPAAHLEFQGTLDHTDVTYAGGVLTGQVVYRPQVTASLQSSLSLAASRLDVVTRHVGTRRTAPGSMLNALAPYRMTDMRLSTSARRGGWMFSPMLSVENLFNRDAAMLVDYPFPTRLWSISLRVRRASSPTP